MVKLIIMLGGRNGKKKMLLNYNLKKSQNFESKWENLRSRVCLDK